MSATTVHTTTLEEIVTPLTTLWNFDYESNVKALRDLYEIAKRDQWNASTDIPWTVETDPAQVGLLVGPEGDPLEDFDFFKDLSDAQRDDLNRRRSAWTLSQFLHGEQGAALCCGQLVEVVPDIDGKLYAATQVIDEARHIEVFHEYIGRLDRVYPMMPGLKALINAVLTAEMWQMKCLGMQVIAESMAMGAFKMMKASTGDLVLRRVLELTERDEARHVSFGLIYLKEELEGLSEQDQIALEDFALAGLGLLMSPANLEQSGRYLFDIMGEVGIDTDAAGKEMAERYEADPDLRAAGTNPIKQYAIPNLERLGLVNDRTRPRFAEMNLLN